MNDKILIKQLKELLDEIDDFIANSANFTSFVFNSVSGLNWCGLYFDNGTELILSIFQGKPACIKIPYNLGVCGFSFTKNEVVIVDDVHEFEGHIACDFASKSELVIPIIINEKVIGVFDIDSPLFARFDEDTVELITKLTEVYLEKTNLLQAISYYNA